MVQIEMADGGIIKIELNPEAAPITCANFEKLGSEGFYDGLIFHRVISGFMIQGGDPTGTGMGGSDETIKGAPSATIPHPPSSSSAMRMPTSWTDSTRHSVKSSKVWTSLTESPLSLPTVQTVRRPK